MIGFWCEIARDVLMVEGPDALTFVQSQVSQDLRDMAIGDARQTLVLDPTGKVVALARVLRSGDNAVVIDTDAGFGEVVASRLSRFKIRVAADITTIPWRCIALRSVGEPIAIALPGGAVAVPAWFGDGTAIDLLGPAPTPPVEVSAGTIDDVEAARIAAGWPAMGAEITSGETLPATLGPVVAVAVSFTKGCYPGQELVERMDSRGATAPVLLQRVEVPAGTRPGDPYVVAGSDAATVTAGPVTAGPVTAGPVTAGTVTSVAGTMALALVRRTPH